MDFTEAEASARRKFTVYRTLLEGIASGQLRHLMVVGGPGIGKTHAAEEVFKRYHVAQDIFYSKHSGHMTPLALYNTLYDCRGPDDVTVFDDCDSVFKQTHAMNLLKAATDTKDQRVLTWSSTTGKAVAPRFSFGGRLVIITNLPLHGAPLAPLTDRLLVCNMDLSDEERTAHVLYVLHKAHGRSHKYDEVANWLIKFGPHIGTRLTIRTAIKVIELAEMTDDWHDLALQTVLSV